MKNIIGTLLMIGVGVGSANASDLPSIKDNGTHVYPGTVSGVNHSGFYITGSLGIASGDRDMSRTIDRNVDLELDTTNYDADDIAEAQAELAAVGVPSSLNGNVLNIPLIADRLGFGDSRDVDSTVFGGELSYLWHMPSRRLGFEIALGATFYNDDATALSHSGLAGQYVGGTALADFNFNQGQFTCADIQTCAGDPSKFTQTGIVTFERDFDIDLIGRVHFFAMDNLSLYAGAGPSFARGKVKGFNVDDTLAANGRNDLSTSFDEDVSSVGYVLNLGAQYWATPRITVGLDYTYKQHDFDASTSGSFAEPIHEGVDLVGASRDRVDIEDGIHAIKGRIGFKFGGTND